MKPYGRIFELVVKLREYVEEIESMEDIDQELQIKLDELNRMIENLSIMDDPN